MARKNLVQRSRQSFTRLARCINQLMREQLACGPVTVQQCYTLEALMDGPRSMKSLAVEVALHQSTLTRVVEKLERQSLVRRTRLASNLRSVEVEITEAGKQTYLMLDDASSQMIANLLDHIPRQRRLTIVAAMEALADLLNPNNEPFQNLLKGCRCGGLAGGGVKLHPTQNQQKKGQ